MPNEELPPPTGSESEHDLTPVGGPAAWTAATLDPKWRRSFTAAEIDELGQGLATFRTTSPDLDLAAVSPETFPLPHLGRELSTTRDRLVDGIGVAAYEGFPVADFAIDELRAIWWAMACTIGTPVAQSHRGDLLGDVRDIGTGIGGRVGRGYTSNDQLNFHADAADISGLFFLRTAAEGGLSKVASSVTTHDRIAKRRPDLLAELYRPMPVSWQGNQPIGEQGWYDIPVFARVGNEVSAVFIRTNILVAHENTGSPPLTERQREAVEYVVEVASEPDMWVERQFEPGAMLFVHNHTMFHLRTAFTDHADETRKRHLLRVWLCPPNSRVLPASFSSFFAETAAGSHRGGYESRNGAYVFATEPA